MSPLETFKLKTAQKTLTLTRQGKVLAEALKPRGTGADARCSAAKRNVTMKRAISLSV